MLINITQQENKSAQTRQALLDSAIELFMKYGVKKVTIDDICNEIYLSSSYFKRIFKNETGNTPYQFLTEIRIERAKEMLKDKELTIREVARLCGFVNPGNLSAVFKRHMGISPSEYRKVYIEK